MFTNNNIDYRNPKYQKEGNLEEFTIKNMDTLNLKSEDHIKTKSQILAPFNTSALSNEFLNDDIKIEDNIVKFNGKVRELNKNYELNNNGEIDNGMIISPNGNTINSINNEPFEQKKEIKKGMIMSNRVSGLCSPVPESNKLLSEELDEEVISQIEKFGYSNNFIVKCLLNNFLNYATASYYLLLKED